MSTTTTAAKKSTANAQADGNVVEGLNLVLADTYALMAMTHFAHWNVEGSDFFPLHKAFQEHYENLFEAADEIAEQVRALGSYAIGGLETLAKKANLEELKAPQPQKDYVAALIVAHEKTVEDLTATRDAAGDVEDLQTQDLMIKRLQWHEKTLWMLKAYLKP